MKQKEWPLLWHISQTYTVDGYLNMTQISGFSHMCALHVCWWNSSMLWVAACCVKVGYQDKALALSYLCVFIHSAKYVLVPRVCIRISYGTVAPFLVNIWLGAICNCFPFITLIIVNRNMLLASGREGQQLRTALSCHSLLDLCQALCNSWKS